MNPELTTAKVISKLFETLSKLKIDSAYDQYKQLIIDDLINLGFKADRAAAIFSEMESVYKSKINH